MFEIGCCPLWFENIVKSFDFGQLEQTPKRIFEIALNQFLIYKSRILNRVLLSKPLSKWF